MTVTHYWTSPGAPLRRGGLDGYEMAFVHQKASEGYPASAIAKMLARNLDVVLEMMPPVVVTRQAPAMAVLAPQAPKPHPTPKPSLDVRLMPVVRRIAEETGFAVEDLLGMSRRRPLTRARQRAYYECYQIMRDDGTRHFSTLRIGHAFSDRDHTTIIHGIEAHAARLKAAEAAA